MSNQHTFYPDEYRKVNYMQWITQVILLYPGFGTVYIFYKPLCGLYSVNLQTSLYSCNLENHWIHSLIDPLYSYRCCVQKNFIVYFLIIHDAFSKSRWLPNIFSILFQFVDVYILWNVCYFKGPLMFADYQNFTG